MKNTLFKALLLTAIVIIISGVTLVFASASDPQDVVIVDQVVLSVGKNEAERNIAWISDIEKAGEVRLVKATELVGGSFPSEYRSFAATASPCLNLVGKYTKAATLTGLLENTKYAYILVADGHSSEIFYFSTGSFSDYEFIFVGDPQVSSSKHGAAWQDTLQKVISNFNSEIIISAGDQVSTPDAEDHYSYFIVDALSSIALATCVGPAHDWTKDTTPSYSDHYNLPNLSDKYGVNNASANYWYTYNNTLFMHLNTSVGGNAAKNGEHEDFMKEAIAANPDVTWKIVVMHHSLYSTASHSDDSEVITYRNYLAPIFTSLDIDVVLSGHDHVYVRSKLMDGKKPSSDVVSNNTVVDPVGTLYLCASSSTGSKFYEKEFTIEEAQFENYDKRKSVIRFEVSDEKLVMKSYFLDDMTVFDSFTIEKVPHVCEPLLVEAALPTCLFPGKREYYECECGVLYEDEEGIVEIKDLSKWGKIPATGHNYSDATCTEPQICSGCEKQKGEPLGHDYKNECDASCNECGELREVEPHIDSNSDNLCDECSLKLTSEEQMPDEEQGTSLVIILVSAGASVVIVGALSTVLIIKKKRKNI